MQHLLISLFIITSFNVYAITAQEARDNVKKSEEFKKEKLEKEIKDDYINCLNRIENNIKSASLLGNKKIEQTFFKFGDTVCIYLETAKNILKVLENKGFNAKLKKNNDNDVKLIISWE